MSENRAPAQYCPYCGETNLWPHEDSATARGPAATACRVFSVKFIGLAGRSGTVPVPEPVTS